MKSIGWAPTAPPLQSVQLIMHEPVARIVTGRIAQTDDIASDARPTIAAKNSGENVAAQERRFLIRVHSIFNRLIRTIFQRAAET
jgi:hypothetical protein